MSLDAALQSLWYARRMGIAASLLLPLAGLFGAIVRLRRSLYRRGVLRSVKVSSPVIVIGNVTAGGTGKTPFTIWLAQELARRGRRVGIVLRGYGGRASHWPQDVEIASSAADVGDEAVLLARRTGAIVVAGPDRVAAARRAIERGARVVLCDDGLQHYRLRREVEIAVIDAARGLGNRRMLPAGPLREPAERLQEVTACIALRKGGGAASAVDHDVPAHAIAVDATLRAARNLTTGEVRELGSFAGIRVHAVAGIGNPQSFFRALSEFGVDVIEHALPDHASIAAEDIDFPDNAPVLMTEKDAVKCLAFAVERHWVVPLEVDVPPEAAAQILALIDRAIL